jgi:multiple sugar transport system substrate-binding protein
MSGTRFNFKPGTISRRTVLHFAGAGVAAATAAGSTVFSPLATIAKQGSNVEIEFAINQSFSEPAHPAMKQIEAFNAKNLGVTVKGTSYGASYEEIMQRAQANISAGIGPAIILTGWKYALFADAALGLTDLREVGGDQTETILARFQPWVADIIRVGDKIAGLPQSVSTPILYYNKDMFAQAGLAEDVSLATWDDVAAATEQIKTNTSVETPLVGGITGWSAQAFIQNNGGFILDDQYKAVFDSAEAIGGMQVWETLRNNGTYTAIPDDQQVPAFLAGSAAMYFVSSASLASLRSNASFEIGTAEFPANGANSKLLPSGGNFLGVYTEDEEQKAAAWKYLDFVSSTEGATIWNETGYMVATLDDIPPLPGSEPAYAQAASGLTAETIWPGARGLEALIVFADWTTKMVMGEVTVEEGMADCFAAINDLIA